MSRVKVTKSHELHKCSIQTEVLPWTPVHLAHLELIGAPPRARGLGLI